MNGGSVSYFCGAESTDRFKKVKDKRNRTQPHGNSPTPTLALAYQLQ
ncbi:MAG: hypothetical protein OXI53_03440 [Nitrospira sp.]|nr:hypothetical protein [Nitrospira sp.]